MSIVNASGKGNEAAGVDDATGRGDGKGGGCTIAQSSRRAQSGRRGAEERIAQFVGSIIGVERGWRLQRAG